MMRLFFGVVGIVFTTPALFSQANWQTVGSGVSDGGIRDMDYDPASGRLYCVGRFQYAGDSLVNGTAYWDGSAWHPMGAGIDNSFVFSPFQCEHLGGDSVMVSGSFHSASDVPDTWRTALWDGTAWRSIGPGGSRGAFWGMLVNEDGLTVAGGFDTIGGVPFNSMARYRNGSWEEICAYPRREDIFSYGAVAKYQDKYVFGGNLNFSPIRELGWLDGDTLRRLGPGIQGDSWVNALAVYNGDLYVGGEFYYSPSGNVASYLMAWDGTTFRDPLPGLVFTAQVHRFDVGNGDLFISGQCAIAGMDDRYTLVRFDGERVCLYAKNVNASFHAIASTDTELFAAPNMPTLGVGGELVNSIVRYDLTGPADTCFTLATGIHGTASDPSNDLSLFPNPVEDALGLSFGNIWENVGSVSIVLHDALGREVRTFTVTPSAAQNTWLPVSDLPKGVYFAHFRARQGVLNASRAFLVQ